MSGKMCNTINQNIVEPYSIKVINDYFKTFGTLLNSSDIDTVKPNDLSARLINDNSNISDYSDPDIEFHEVWDRGKFSNPTQNKSDDVNCLRRLENSVINLESCLGTFNSNHETANKHSKLVFNIKSCPSSTDDTLSDVDLEKFERDHVVLEHRRSAIFNGPGTTASLSDFHNVSEVLLSIRQRLASFLKSNQDSSAGQTASSNNKQTLEENISTLKTELESYLKVINEKKEDELRRFSENMVNEEKLLKIKKAFLRKEKLETNFYETLTFGTSYAIANNETFPSTLLTRKDDIHVKNGFTMRNCYDNDYVFDTKKSSSDYTSGVEFYTMLVNEEKSEVLNDAPDRFQARERISLIFKDHEEIIRNWQNYQLRTVPRKSCKFKMNSKALKVKNHDVWGFTLSSAQNQTLQLKLKKEQQKRLVFRVSSYILSIVLFVIVVYLSESIFTFNKRASIDF